MSIQTFMPDQPRIMPAEHQLNSVQQAEEVQVQEEPWDAWHTAQQVPQLEDIPPPPPYSAEPTEGDSLQVHPLSMANEGTYPLIEHKELQHLEETDHSAPLPSNQYPSQDIQHAVVHEEHYPSSNQHNLRTKSVRRYKEKPHIQVVSQATDSKSSVADSMQMMMMNSMMMQQMQAQQMQSAQMAAMNQQNLQIQAQHLQRQSAGNGKMKKPQGSINIHIEAASQEATIESMALDNWQEATIILCFAAVGLIYLICSRAGAEEKKEDLARKHMS
ncbi:uncharacterized protein I303_100437 [Kwoniella dejecticola CBS 10117]|uniref:Uncharacterized protein n=1 Tax=Kwoniella dejecticola CBS 10117 TaxID=1296121 RepID=A0A1A6AEZ3_9TREE|nr:uncharacterized protein I303_00436 [Kwoniella dejecticola CBS 10117]OBR88619.1 hypothetical protein I303_00436 [Kwoniella dejecticola CBS 10117]